MAISRISGNILQDNLQRGANLSIQGNLAYFNVVDNRVGINTNVTPQDLTVAGNLGIGPYLIVDSNTVTSLNTLYLDSSGNIDVYSTALAGTSYINNVTDPLAAQDAATKNYVDTALSSLLTFEDDGANTTGIAAGDTVFFNGTANQISVVVSSLAVNFSLTPDVIISGNFDAGNITTGGNITATGNIQGGNIISDGAVIGNVTISGNLTVANLTVTDYLTGNIINGNTVSVLGNVTGGNLISNAGIYGATLNVTGNAAVGNLQIASTTANRILYTNANNDVTTTNNLTFNGSALILTGTANVSGNTTVGNLYSLGLINAVGNIVGANVTANGNVNGNNFNVTKDIYAGGNAVIDGNLTVNGDLIYENVTTLAVEDPIISMGRGANNTPLVANDGKDRGEQLWYFSGTEKSAFIGYDNSTGNLIAAVDVSIANEIVTVNQFGTWQIGNLYGQSALITGNIVSGNLNTGIITATGNISTSANIIATGNITGGNLTTAGIANVGTLIVTGNTSITGNLSAGNITTNLANAANVQVQSLSANRVVYSLNNDGLLVDSANFTFDGTDANIQGSLQVDNINFNGTDITSNANLTIQTSANGNLNLTPNGTGEVVASTLSVTDLSANRVVYSQNNDGSLVDSANFTFDGTNANIQGSLQVDNLNFNGDIISTTDTNGNLILDPNGTGAVIIDGLNNFVTGNLTIEQDLVVNGNTTYINITDLNVEDPIIQLGRGANNTPLVSNDGKDRGTGMWYYTTAEHEAFVGYQNLSGKIIAATNVSIANEVVSVNQYGTFVVGTLQAETGLVTANITSNSSLTISTGSNGNIILDPNGTGVIILTDELANSVPYLDANKSIQTVSNFTFDGANLNVQGKTTLDNFEIDGTTITSNANLTIQSSLNGNVNITPNGTGVVNIDNIAIADNTISSTSGNIVLDPAANIILPDELANAVIYSAANKELETSANFTFDGANANIQGRLVVDNFTIDGTGITSNANITVQSSSNGNIDITPNGTGVVNINNIAIADNTISSTTGNIIVDPAANIVLPDELANSVLYLTAGKEIETSANLTFDGANLILFGRANIDNITVDGTTITSNANLSLTATSGNLVLTPGSTGVTQISSSTALTVPVGNTAQRPATPDQGAMRFNNSTLVLEIWDGTQWDVVGQDLALITSQTINGDGTTVAFTLNETTTSGGILVSINGVSQIPDQSYGVVGNVITFSEAPQVSDAVEVRFLTQIQTVTEIINTSGNSNVSVSANASQVNITGNLLPTANVVYSLGNSTLRWNDLYLAGNSIYLGNVIITNASGNSVSFFAADGTTPATISSGGGLDIGTGNLSVGNIINNNANGVGNIGNSTGYFNTIFAKATSAQYADLAEYFESDQAYDTGTVMIFAGDKEITQSTQYADQRLSGIVSTDPAFTMNSSQPNSVPIAMAGRVPCWVVGPVKKGDVLTTAGVAGHAVKLFDDDWKPGVIVGKALESCPEGRHKIMVVVGAW